MTNNLSRIKKDLKSFAKRVKDFKYTDKVLVMFLLTGTIGIENNLFSAQTTDTAIENQIKQINTSVHNFEQNLKKTKDKNNKSIKQSNLELIQLMEQGDHVIKSTWSNWQYATGENYNDWQGTYKGFGDKNAKYPYEGIFERSLNVYERFVSPSSENYNLLGRSKKLASATGMANGYGLTNINVATEPLIGFEVSAEINPRNINKPPITISDKTAITPTLPTPISFTPPKPIIKLPVLPNLPKPPSFNIKLGSFCNGMSGGCRSYGTDGGQYNYGTPNTIGIPRTYTVGTIFNLINSITLNDNNPSLTHGWASDFGGHSALFYAYFDVLNQRINGTALLNGNLTITSVNPVQSDASLSSYNKQKFLVGGSRIGTLDNVRGGTLKNNATINLIGPLTIGFEVQSDRFFGNDAKTRTLENDGIITDEGEKNSIELDGLLAKGTGTTILELALGLGGPAKIKVSRTSEGFTGYKTGLIMTYEQDDTLSDSKYILKNNNIIKFTGEKSIGIQVFAPGSSSRVEVSNTNNSSITLGGIESYGMKWSSRVADNSNSTMDNSGTLKISGDAGTKLFPNGTAQIRDSLSSGIAVIEDSSSGSGSSAIRAYNGKVTNNGVINVSGGKGNAGMVLVVNAADDVTNISNGTINVNSAAGRQNIAMRVDKGSVPTDAPGTPKAINGGNIYLDGDSSIGIVGTNADVKNTGNIETTTSKTIINGIGMATRGGVLENSGTINLKGSGVSSNIGVYMVKGTSNPSGTLASTSIIKVKGDDSTGALISNGTLNYSGNITAEGNGVSGLIIGDNASNTTNATITNNGLITVNNGTAAAGIYTYTDNSSGTPVTVKKGSYGIVVGKNSKLISDGTNNINVNIDVKGTESLGLYAGENGTGKISLGNTMNATIEGGTTPAERGNAFYYVGNGTTFGATEISNWAKNNFGDGKTSTLGNLNLTMNAGSRLFIAQNTGMNLSDTTGVTISSATGANIIGTDYKTFMLYLSKLTINQDVDLNNTTDGYNHLEIANSSITNAANKTMTGIQANDVAMAQENNKSLYARNKVTLANEGNINLSGTTSTRIYAKFGELHNRATGVITIANKSTAMYGIGDSLLENAGKITVGTNSIAMYSEGSTTQAMKNNGTIELPQTDSVAMSYKPDSTLSSGTVLENAGNIQLTGDKNTAICAAGTPAYTAKNSGTITLTNSATINNPNVGLYATNKAATLENTGILNIGKNAIGIYGYKAENSGKLNVGNAGIGIYSQNGDVSLTGGKITTGTDEAVGVYTVGTGQNITNTGTAFDIGNNSFGFVNVGTGNKIVSSIANVGFGNKNVYVYSNDTTGFVINSTNITSTGQENYGIYSAGTVTNSGTIDYQVVQEVWQFTVLKEELLQILEQ
ncbi:MAG: autotransporter-associated N-terminal domain-containing protein [Leptotrichia wadei]